MRNDEWIGHGHGSPSGWMAAATGEPYRTASERCISVAASPWMRETRRVFELGLPSEQMVGDLTDARAEPLPIPSFATS